MVAHRGGNGVSSTAALLVVLVVVVCALGAFQASWALERSSTVITWLKDGAVHFLGERNGELYFVSQAQLWKTNGTPAGTVLLSNATPLVSFQEGYCPVFSPHFARGATANGLFFFSASDGVHGQELWRSDGTGAGTQMVKDLDPAHDSIPHDFVPVNGAVHFRTVGPAVGVWRSDGTDPGTSFLADQTLPLGSLDGFYVFERNGELWRSDGTAPGTVMLAVLDPGGNNTASFLTKDTGKLYFIAAGPRVWMTDGTAAGTVPLLDAPGYGPAMTCDAGLCYFVDTESQGSTIWRTDGTPQGTVKIADLPDNNAGKPIIVNGTAYFTTLSHVWRSDGTPAGTQPIFSDPSDNALFLKFSAGDFFFIVRNQSNQRHLWRSDGSAAGTREVADLGTSLNNPNVVIVDDTLVLGVWGQVLVDGAVTTEQWRVQKFDRATEQLVTLADEARNAVHCPTPMCTCTQGRPEQSEVVAGKWYFEALDHQTFMPKLGVVTDVFFRDVPPDHWAFSWVERIAVAGLTGGCGTDAYCPDAPVSRAEMAVLLLRGIKGTGHTPPPATGNVFADVPADFWAAGWIEELAAEGITAGCGDGRYCPLGSVTRAEMAVFLLRAAHGEDYTPPPATGTRFADVPLGHWAGSWIEQLALEGITGGCGGGNYCPDNPVTRAQMAVFLARTFGL